MRRVHHPELLELEGHAVVEVVADVLFVGQHLVGGGASPFPIEIRPDAEGHLVSGVLSFDSPKTPAILPCDFSTVC